MPAAAGLARQLLSGRKSLGGPCFAGRLAAPRVVPLSSKRDRLRSVAQIHLAALEHRQRVVSINWSFEHEPSTSRVPLERRPLASRAEVAQSIGRRVGSRGRQLGAPERREISSASRSLDIQSDCRRRFRSAANMTNNRDMAPPAGAQIQPPVGGNILKDASAPSPLINDCRKFGSREVPLLERGPLGPGSRHLISLPASRWNNLICCLSKSRSDLAGPSRPAGGANGGVPLIGRSSGLGNATPEPLRSRVRAARQLRV